MSELIYQNRRSCPQMAACCQPMSSACPFDIYRHLPENCKATVAANNQSSLKNGASKRRKVATTNGRWRQRVTTSPEPHKSKVATIELKASAHPTPHTTRGRASRAPLLSCAEFVLLSVLIARVSAALNKKVLAWCYLPSSDV